MLVEQGKAMESSKDGTFHEPEVSMIGHHQKGFIIKELEFFYACTMRGREPLSGKDCGGRWFMSHSTRESNGSSVPLLYLTAPYPALF